MKSSTQYFLQGKKNLRRFESIASWADLFFCADYYMSYFAYACKTEGKNGISHLISGLCVNCLSSIPEYSRLNHLDVYLV